MGSTLFLRHKPFSEKRIGAAEGVTVIQRSSSVPIQRVLQI